MTREERRSRLREAYRTIAAELDSHRDNGSDWLFLERDDRECAPEVGRLRLQILGRVVDYCLRKAEGDR